MPLKSALKKTNSWKDKQSRELSRKRVKLALIVLLLSGVFLFGSWFVTFIRYAFTPGQGSVRTYRWSGEFNINLAIRGSGIAVFSLNPKEGKITVLNIPEQTFLEVPRGYGSWQMRAVYGLGGNQLLKETLSSYLAVPIDGFLDLTDAKGISASGFVEKLRGNPFSGFSLLSSSKTDLTLWERFLLKMAVRGVRFDKIEEVDPLERNILDKSILPDASEVYTADSVRLDSILGAFADPSVTGEHKSIAVFNAAGKPQLAQKWARLIANLGGNVIITGNAKEVLPKTVVWGGESKTLKRLRQIFELDCQNKPKCVNIAPSDEDLASSRAEINVFLGEDYADK